ncbi:hypothetical protein ACFLZV_05780, partial [Candidatus Margulisiibacteriota bacterium]
MTSSVAMRNLSLAATAEESMSDEVKLSIDAQRVVREVLIPAVRRAKAHVAVVIAQGDFNWLLSPEVTGGDDYIDLDNGEVYAVSTVLNIVNSLLCHIAAYDWTLSEANEMSVVDKDFFDSNPNFGILRQDGLAYMQEAKDCLSIAVDHQIAIFGSLIDAETDDQSDDPIGIDDLPKERFQVIEDILNPIKNSLAGQTVVINMVHPTNNAIQADLGVNLANFYNNPIQDIRDYMINVSGDVTSESFPEGFDFSVQGLFPDQQSVEDWMPKVEILKAFVVIFERQNLEELYGLIEQDDMDYVDNFFGTWVRVDGGPYEEITFNANGSFQIGSGPFGYFRVDEDRYPDRIDLVFTDQNNPDLRAVLGIYETINNNKIKVCLGSNDFETYYDGIGTMCSWRPYSYYSYEIWVRKGSGEEIIGSWSGTDEGDFKEAGFNIEFTTDDKVLVSTQNGTIQYATYTLNFDTTPAQIDFHVDELDITSYDPSGNMEITTVYNKYVYGIWKVVDGKLTLVMDRYDFFDDSASSVRPTNFDSNTEVYANQTYYSTYSLTNKLKKTSIESQEQFKKSSSWIIRKK